MTISARLQTRERAHYWLNKIARDLARLIIDAESWNRSHPDDVIDLSADREWLDEVQSAKRRMRRGDLDDETIDAIIAAGELAVAAGAKKAG